MLNVLLSNPQRLFGLILTPTRELAFQISEQIEALGNNYITYWLVLFLQFSFQGHQLESNVLLLLEA